MKKVITCKKCEIRFTANVFPSNIKQGRTYEYCSNECRSAARVKRVNISCSFCNKVTSVWESKVSTKKYCDRDCKAKHQSILNKGKIVNKSGIPWNKGKKGLQVAWNKGIAYTQIRKGNPNNRHIAMGRVEYISWRDKVFQRDNYTCQICEQYGVKIHADHIKPWAEYPELRYEVTNGRALCVPCHYYVTFKKKMPIGSKWGTARIRRLQ